MLKLKGVRSAFFAKDRYHSCNLFFIYRSSITVPVIRTLLQFVGSMDSMDSNVSGTSPPSSFNRLW